MSAHAGTGHGRTEYDKGLHDIGNGIWAYLQPDGGWGWSNAGLIVDGDQSLLVDTLFDEKLTQEMLDAIAGATKLGPADIGTVVNTHANGDHTHGNGLLPEAEIIASAATAEEMESVTPDTLAAMVAAAPDMGEVGEYFLDIFGMFDFANVNMRKPTFTFDRTHSMVVGDKAVELTNVGPAHTAGDVLVHVPGDRVVYTGDILFIEGTPLMWDGPVGNWLSACDLIMDMDVEAIVPGHGPITDKAGVQRVKDYLEFVNREARQRYDAGMPWDEAATDIHLGEFAGWGDSERIAVNSTRSTRSIRAPSTVPTS